MTNDRPIGIAVQNAVCDPSCALSRELRHYVMVLAVLADRRTGRGLTGQRGIAEAMGVSKRTVQRLQADLDATKDSPVRVVRSHRARPDGRGRTSDEYQLVLVGVDQGDTGVTLKNVQGDTPGTTKATSQDDQSDTAVSYDPGSCPGRDPGRSPVAPSHRLKLHWIAELKRLRGTDATLTGREWKRAMKSFGQLHERLKGDMVKAERAITMAMEDSYRSRIMPWDIDRDAVSILARQRPESDQATGRTEPTEAECRRRDARLARFEADDQAARAKLIGDAGQYPMTRIHDEYKRRTGRSEHVLDIHAQMVINEALAAHGEKACMLVLKHASCDPMVNGSGDAKGARHDSLKYIFGNDAFSRIHKMALEREGRSRGLDPGTATELAKAR